jgi:redox-sensitive bicupin YhaK (pirin superfamily)
MSATLHRSHQRGHAEHGWLHSRFSFSFAEYHNLQRMGFGVLRVINDDIIEPEGGFGMHPHHDMEIITIVTKGRLEHKDSFGNHGIIEAGEIQYMSAGSGVYHSEFNPSSDETTELLQIWIRPKQKGGDPRYDSRDFSSHDQDGRWVLLVSGDEDDDAITIRQNARIYTTTLQAGQSLDISSNGKGLGRLVFVLEGSVEIAGETLFRRDELQIIDSHVYEVKSLEGSQVIVFEVPLKG